jgi:RNA polymerase sigma-70 factor (ECF subfamily)
MPPLPHEYRGIEAATQFMRMLLRSGRRYRLLPTRANEQPALAAYTRTADALWQASGLFVLSLTGTRINAAVRFEATCFGWFGMPPELPEH